jgi:Xaa-Pro aminopeptidase
VSHSLTLNRLGVVQSAMAARDIDLLVIGPSSNLRYVLDYRALRTDRLTALVVSQASAVMIMPDFELGEFVEATGFSEVAPWSDRAGPRPAVNDAFARLGTMSARPRTIVEDDLPFQFFWHLQGRLGPEPRPSTEFLGELRLIKSPEEQERIARTGELVSVGIDVAQRDARPGITERDLKREIEAALWEGGAETVDYVLVQAGANSAAPHHSAGHDVLRTGEPVLVDIGVCMDDYFADITQQAFLGDPPIEYSEAYEVVRAAQEAGVAAARAGAVVGDVASEASAVIIDSGYGDWNGPRTGHGLGVDIHEPPSVIEGNDTELQPGMVITIEPGVYIPGRYGIRIEDTVLVTEGEAQRLTRGARPLFAKPA